MPDVVLLAIESSCDETSAAIIRNGTLLSNIIQTQEIHAQYGGVVPEAASRLHLKYITPIVNKAITQSKISLNELHAIAYTQSPGLLGSLLVGATFAKSMALCLDIPTIAVNHMQAHVISNLISDNKPSFPFLCLTVSGGHTQLVVCHHPTRMEIIGETIDDAAGECFDKAAKMLGLAYPGGPLIDKYAQLGNPHQYTFAKPNIEKLNFSFSGLKTSILYFIQKMKAANPAFVTENLIDICASIQHSIIDILIKKITLAVRETGITQIGIAGGVSANKGLRTTLQMQANKHKWKIFIPSFEYCTDNAAMIAMMGYYKYLEGQFDPLHFPVSARGTW